MLDNKLYLVSVVWFLRRSRVDCGTGGSKVVVGSDLSKRKVDGNDSSAMIAMQKKMEALYKIEAKDIDIQGIRHNIAARFGQLIDGLTFVMWHVGGTDHMPCPCSYKVDTGMRRSTHRPGGTDRFCQPRTSNCVRLVLCRSVLRTNVEGKQKRDPAVHAHVQLCPLTPPPPRVTFSNPN